MSDADAIARPEPLLLLATSLPKRPPVYRLTLHLNKGEISISKGLYELLALGSPAGVAFVIQNGQYYVTRSDATNAYNVRTHSQPKFGVVTVTITSKPTVNYFRTQLGEPEASAIVVPVDPQAVDPLTVGFLLSEHAYPLYRLVMEQAQPKPTVCVGD